jgi:hypothetical protein
MATVNFSIPEDVKEAFNKAFAQQNKSAVIADLMRDAVARVNQVKVRRGALRRITARRDGRNAVGDGAIRSARNNGRS